MPLQHQDPEIQSILADLEEQRDAVMVKLAQKNKECFEKDQTILKLREAINAAARSQAAAQAANANLPVMDSTNVVPIDGEQVVSAA